MRRQCHPIGILSILLLILIMTRPAFCQDNAKYITPPSLKNGIKPAEDIILKKLSSEEVSEIDLQKDIGENKELRIVRGEFIKALLSGEFQGLNIHNQGINIKNAIISGEIKLLAVDVPFDVTISNTSFKDLADFEGSHFKKNLKVIDSTFEKKANFHRVKVDRSVFFNGTNFEDEVNFYEGRIGDEFSFLGKKAGQRAICKKEFDINGLRIGGKAVFSFVTFEENTIFRNVNIGSIFYLWDVIFGGNADFEYANVGHSLNIEQSKFRGEAVFRGIEVKKDLWARCATFEKNVNFENIRVGGISEFNDAVFDGPASFEDSTLNIIRLCHIQLPKARYTINFDGMTYNKLITSKNNPDDYDCWHNSLLLLNNIKFNINNYQQLESYYNHIGHKNIANEIYISGKTKEYLLGWRNPINIIILILWGELTGFGRKPYLAFLYGLVIVLFGAIFIFTPQYITEVKFPVKWKLQKRHAYICRFLISLEQFTPMIKLGMTEYWKPQNIPTYLLFYIYFHRFLGWIMIPIGITAIVTQLR